MSFDFEGLQSVNNTNDFCLMELKTRGETLPSSAYPISEQPWTNSLPLVVQVVFLPLTSQSGQYTL